MIANLDMHVIRFIYQDATNDLKTYWLLFIAPDALR